MYEKIIIAGSGGQGIMFLGNLLCNVAASLNKYTTFFPSYGAEIRGGTANCSVIIADDEIGSPVIAEPSILIVMNEQSYNRFLPKLKKGGLLFVNSSLVFSAPPDAVQIPATEIALQVGDVRAANMVMLGKFIKDTKVFPVAAVNDVIKKVLENKKNLLEVNLFAFMRGTKL
ncbi:MAG: 2-oxoacid:acceptor oxidoreductase family protein [Elusimicrobia bacterium]|nr:2-oxoacid:acceptor oxidoreductase family protein [Elusimicrobiota bacterium]